MPKSLSRTSSASSVATDDGSHSVFVDGLLRRTRKRFTHNQLSLLEDLFYKTEHPSRAEREDVAQQGNMEVKSVTIWFQNRRQSRRKDAAMSSREQREMFEKTPVPHEFMAGASLDALEPSTFCASVSYNAPPRKLQRRSSSPSNTSLFSSSSGRTFHGLSRSDCARPSLDRVASRSERRVLPPCTPPRENPVRTPPSQTEEDEKPIWEVMASSPLAPNNSPLAKDLMMFGNKRSLEWACARHRIRRKEDPRIDEELDSTYSSKGDSDVETEDEDMEAITPDGSIALLTSESPSRRKGCGFGSHRQNKMALPNIIVQDDETMDAALALCGLGNEPPKNPW